MFIKKLTEGIGAGWGWYLLLGIMGKMVEKNSFGSAFSIVAELILIVSTLFFYFYIRKKYFDTENKLPNFTIKAISRRAGFYSLILYSLLLFVILLIDKKLS